MYRQVPHEASYLLLSGYKHTLGLSFCTCPKDVDKETHGDCGMRQDQH